MIRINLDKMPLTLVSGDSSERDTRPLAAAGTVQVHVKLLICDMFIISWNLISFQSCISRFVSIYVTSTICVCIQKKYFT